MNNNTQVQSTALFTRTFTGSKDHRFSELLVESLDNFSEDNFRGWCWDGETASYLAYVGDKTMLYIRSFDGKIFGEPEKLKMGSYDNFRGWNWDGETASYLAFVDGKTMLYIRPFDGKTFGEHEKLEMGSSDNFQGWCWDGETASYLAFGNGKTILYVRPFDGKFFGKHEELNLWKDWALGCYDNFRGWNWDGETANYIAFLGETLDETSKESRLSSPLNGLSVNLLDIMDPGERIVYQLRQIGPFTWVGTNASNRPQHYYTETNRHTGIVYLYDPSRDIKLEINLNSNKIINGRMFWNSIVKASSTINGYIVNKVAVQSSNGIPAGGYHQTGDLTWVQVDPSDTVLNRYREAKRDNGSVYLNHTSKNYKVQLNLLTKKVIQHDGVALFGISGASSSPSNVGVTSNLPVKGQNVNTVYFGGNGQPSGTYRQTGSTTWVETDSEQQVKFEFEEVKRDQETVYLFDASRDSRLELNLGTKQITFIEKGNWPGLFDGSGIDAAVRFDDNRAYFFKGDEYIRWDIKKDRVSTDRNYPAPIKGNWTGLFDGSGIDAAVRFDDNRAYFFKGDTYIRWDIKKDRVSTAGTYPAPIEGNWTGLFDGSGIDAAVRIDDNHACFFKGDEYIRWDIKKDRVSTDRNYPAPIRESWPGLFDGTGIDTVVRIDDNHACFFKGDGYIRWDIKKDRVSTDRNYPAPIQTKSSNLYNILKSSATLNGWLVSKISFGSDEGEKLGEYRQTSDTHWTEFNKSGNALYHYEEARREDWSVFLHDPERDVSLQMDLHRKKVRYTERNEPTRDLFRILNDSVESDIWLHSENITSRSSLTEDFDIDKNNSRLLPKPVYRTSVTVSPVTSTVDVWASEEVQIEIDGKTFTIDPVNFQPVKPSDFFKLSISIPATDVRCPHLMLRTNLMMPDQRHYVFPDVEVHKKIIGLKKDDLFNAREPLGIPSAYTREDLSHFQRALQNIAGTVQHTYNKTPHGVHHDRALLPSNMEHPHFVLDFAGNKPRYKPLRPSEVPQYIAGARLIQGGAALSFWDDLGKVLLKADSVVFHTVENIRRDIVQTAAKVRRDYAKSVIKVGEDIVHGDILHAGQELLQGGENLGKDVTSIAGHVVGDVVSGAGQLVVVTLKTAEEAVQFVLTHTGSVGKTLSMLFNKIGVGLKKAVDWLLDKIGWSDILHTHDVLIDMFNKNIDTAKTIPAMLKKEADKFFTHLTEQISDDIDLALNQFDVLKISNRPQPVQGHSGAIEKVEWFMNKFSQHSSNTSALPSSPLETHQENFLDDLLSLLEEKVGKDGDKIIGAIENAGIDFSGIFRNPQHAPEYLIGAFLEVLKAVATICLDAINIILDAILDMIISFIDGFKTTLNTPWHIPFIGDLYEAITEGRQLSLLSFTCLAIAIPTTIIYKSVFKEAPFKAQNVGATLTPIDSVKKGLGFTYTGCHAFLMLTDTGADVIKSEGGQNVLTLFNLGAGFVAQIVANPIPAGENAIASFGKYDIEDVFEAPDCIAHWIWLGQWLGWAVNLIAGGGMVALKIKSPESLTPDRAARGASFISIWNGVFGLIHLGGMIILAVSDGKKSDALKVLDKYNADHNDDDFNVYKKIMEYNKINEPWKYSSNEGKYNGVTLETWIKNAYNYHEWAQKEVGGGIYLKNFGNVMDTLPEIAKFGTLSGEGEDTMEISTVVAGLMDSIGHLSETIAYGVRTQADALL